MKQMELYLHIPFCVKKCDYCDFLSGPAGRGTQEAYVHALLCEIHGQGRKDREITSIFLGGGTPSILKPEWIRELMDAVREEFHLAEDCEITIEANPGTLDREKLRIYKDAGINRLSIGLQSPRDEELKTLGRVHDYRQFLESFYLARETGFDNINVDLMFAIPDQTYDGWIHNLHTVAKLMPEHISAYSLIVEEGTPFARRALNLPDEDIEYRMYEDVKTVLEPYGYEQYEISNYGKPGYACRHNEGYWKRTDYLGLGLGAASLMENVRFSNTGDMEQYLKSSGDAACIRENVETLSKEDQMAEFMFLGLRMTRGIAVKEFQEQFGISIENIYGKVLEKYKGMELLEEKDGRIFLTRKGIHVSNHVMSEFLL